MNRRAEFCRELREATELVSLVGRNELSFQDFVRRYDNFYYAAALDGHEGGLAHELLAVAKVHREVQGILDSVYVGPDRAAATAAGRIDAAAGCERLKTLVSMYDLSAMISALSNAEACD